MPATIRSLVASTLFTQTVDKLDEPEERKLDGITVREVTILTNSYRKNKVDCLQHSLTVSGFPISELKVELQFRFRITTRNYSEL